MGLPAISDIRAAAERIAPYAHRTPVMTSAFFDRLLGARVFFKCENFQKVGAFKFRGAWNAVSKLSDDVATRGVVTHRSGNHAQALALAARMRNIPAYIVMPKNAPAVKRAAVVGYGATVGTSHADLNSTLKGTQPLKRTVNYGDGTGDSFGWNRST